MPSAKQFMGNTTMSNKKIALMIKSGTKCKIMEIEIKQTPATKEECIAVRVKGCDGWIRVNSTSIQKLIPKFGDDTDDWVGKDVIIEHMDTLVAGNPQKQLTIKPA